MELVNRYLLLFMLIVACQAPTLWAASDVISLETAEFVMHPGHEIPLDTVQWEAVTLPHYWEPERYESGQNGWYRFSVKADPWQSIEAIGIYLRRYNMNAAIYINGSLLADGGSFSEPISRNWNYPLYSRIPSGLWRKTENTIHIRLASYPVYGYLAPVSIGPTTVLDTSYDRQLFYQIELSKALFPITLALGLFILVIGLRWRQDSYYLWFACAVIVWAVFSINLSLKDHPFSNKSWEVIAQSSVEWWVVLFCIFSYRFVGKSLPRLEKCFIGYAISATLIYLLVDMSNLRTATSILHAGSILIGLFVTSSLAIDAYKQQNWLYARFAIGLGMLLGLGIWDWMFQNRLTDVTGDIALHLHHYLSPIIFLLMAWHLIGRFVKALSVSSKLNRELESRVAAAQDKIESDYQTIMSMEKRQAILHERERLSREIHDGISGNVSNAIMITELLERDSGYGQRRLHQLRTHLNDGLSEMRNLILTMEEEISTVDQVVSHIADKYHQSLSPLDIEFHSDITMTDVEVRLSQGRGLNLLRIFQEILNNILRHSQADQVNLRVNQTMDVITMVVEDNGKGFDLDNTPKQHYGLINLHKRADESSFELNINSQLESGTRIQVFIPVA